MTTQRSDHRGFFLTLEGGEGTGKSTLSEWLKEQLQASGFDVVQTREPGGTPLAETVRNLVLFPPKGDAWSPLSQALLINAARADHIEKLIQPALDQGQFVICDRFSDSTLAYQSVGGAVSMQTLRRMDASRLKSAIPDLTLVLDASPEELMGRRAKRGEAPDVFEDKDLKFHRDVCERFRQIAADEPDRCILLDALEPVETTGAKALELISGKFEDVSA